MIWDRCLTFFLLLARTYLFHNYQERYANVVSAKL
jgi:hypothetical protein